MQIIYLCQCLHIKKIYQSFRQANSQHPTNISWVFFFFTNVFFLLCLRRKLLRDHQLEAVTKAAQQDELERRRRLEHQRQQEFPVPLLPEYTTGESVNLQINASINTNTGQSDTSTQHVSQPKLLIPKAMKTACLGIG